MAKKSNAKKLLLTHLWPEQNTNDYMNAINGIPYAKVVLTPESGFFLLIDFSNLKKNGIINSERELLEYLYLNSNVKFLVG